MLTNKYGQHDEEDAEVIVALGGDGAMLDSLRRQFEGGKPVYGMNRGTVGFLMNEYGVDALPDRINAAERAVISPLRMTVRDVHEHEHHALAINEVSRDVKYG